MLNYVWLGFLLVAVLVGGFTGKLPELTSGAFEGAVKAVMNVVLPLLGIWAVWLGTMRLAERAGLVQALATALRPLMRRLFPDVPRDHPAVGAMVMNMAANMLGLGNAATPLGLRAMRLLESLNPSPGVATNAMCTFLALNTASIQILPLTAIGILVTAGAKSATSIVITAFLATVCAACAGVLAAKFFEKLPRFRVQTPSTQPAPEASATAEAAEAEESVALEKIELPPLTRKGQIGIELYLAAFGAMFLLLLFPGFFSNVLGQLHAGWSAPSPPPDFEGKGLVIRSLMAISLLAIPFLLSFFPLYAACRGVPVYEQFVEGAKEAWDTARRTIPYLVAMLVAIGMLQKAGVIDVLTHWISPLLGAVGFPADLLPMVLMRPLSGSATNGLFVELVQRLHDPDGFVSRLAGTIYGSTETTFYVLTVYFGSVSIRQTRHAVITGLTADTVAVVASVVFCRLLFR
jgi:spore maturation protein SpmA